MKTLLLKLAIFTSITLSAQAELMTITRTDGKEVKCDVKSYGPTNELVTIVYDGRYMDIPFDKISKESLAYLKQWQDERNKKLQKKKLDRLANAAAPKNAPKSNEKSKSNEKPKIEGNRTRKPSR